MSYLVSASQATLLVEAGAGNLARVKLALSQGANPKVQNAMGQTALMEACGSGGSAECAAFLLPLSDPLARNRIGRTALFEAAHAGCPDRVAMLLPVSDLGCADKHGESPLMRACEGEESEASLRSLALLLGAFDPRGRDRDRNTPLMYAAFKGRSETLAKLLPLSDPLAVNARGESALMMAASAWHLHASARCIEILLPVSDLGARDQNGRAARELAWERRNGMGMEVFDAEVARLEALGLSRAIPQAGSNELAARKARI